MLRTIANPPRYEVSGFLFSGLFRSFPGVVVVHLKMMEMSGAVHGLLSCSSRDVVLVEKRIGH